MNWFKKISQQPIKSDALQAIVDKWRAVIPGLVIYVYEYKQRILLDNINIPKDKRKQGLGRQIMTDLINYADQIGKRMELMPGVKDKDQGTTSRGRLVKFYKRFGFLENRGRNKDYSMTETMFREPQEIKE